MTRSDLGGSWGPVLDRNVEQQHTDLIYISSLTTATAAAAFAYGAIEKLSSNSHPLEPTQPASHIS